MVTVRWAFFQIGDEHVAARLRALAVRWVDHPDTKAMNIEGLTSEADALLKALNDNITLLDTWVHGRLLSNDSVLQEVGYLCV